MNDPKSGAACDGVFGLPPPILADVHASARQFSPLIPNSDVLEDTPEGSLAGMVMLAPPGTIERRYELAAMLRALAPEAPFAVLALKDMGGARLAGELGRFGCTVEEAARRHHRICHGRRPARLVEIDAALAEGAPWLVDGLGLWSQPGIFSWDRIDPGTALLLEVLPKLAGRGADLGCGIGVLAHGVLASPKVTRLDLVDIDRRAVAAARRNVDDPRASFWWADVRIAPKLDGLDFVVMNPPFHDAGSEDRGLGQIFIQRAATALRPGGHLWLTANRHLPYEGVLSRLFKQVSPVITANGFKVLEARK